MRFSAFILISICIVHTNLFAQWKTVQIDQLDTISNFEYYRFYDVCFPTPDIGYIVGGIYAVHFSQGIILKTTNGGKSWSVKKSTQHDCPYHCQCIDEQTGYIGTVADHGGEGGIQYGYYKSIDGGENWHGAGNKADLFFINPTIGWSFHFGYLFKTNNGGENWELISDSLQSRYDINNSLFFIDENNGWFLDGYYQDGVTNYVARTTDGGNEWIVSDIETMLPLNKITFINENSGWLAGGYVYADENNPILFKTNDKGASWIEIPDQEYLINDFTFDNNNDGLAVGEFIGGYGVIFETNNGGHSWTAVADSLSQPLRALFYNNGIGWAVGDSGLVLTNDPEYTSLPAPMGNSPEQIISLEVFPNPIQTSAVISYKLQVAGNIELNIYDLTGRKITALVKETQAPGRYKVEWNAAGYTKGIYFYELSVGNSRLIKKMILMK